MITDDVRGLALFDGLSDAQVNELVSAGREVPIERGVELFREGAPADHWWLLVDGAIDLVRRVGREDVTVAEMNVPGRWAGGFRAWDENGTYLATGRGAVPGRLLRVPAEVLRDRSDAWFPFGGHLIRGLYRTARTIESTARQRESLVALGTLAAGLAHEINNPAAAATRAVSALESSTQSLLSALARLAHADITAAQFATLDELRRELDPAATDPDPLERADLEDALSGWLRRHGIDRGWTLAGPLARAGAGLGWCGRVAEVLPGTELQPGLEWVVSTFSVATQVGEVKESTRRISELVAAVRTYSQLDRASAQRVDITDGLDSTLRVMAHTFGPGLTVERDFAPGLPAAEVYPGELNQVWTNLIDNAVDAMGGTGTLRLSTRADGDHLVVEVSDTGPGFTAEAADHAFEAFYTTKEVGQGTGLGLDIARRIVVDRHGGTIGIGSRPGETVVTVRLPVERLS